MRDPVIIRAERTVPEAILPTKAYEDDLGWDFYLPDRQDSLGGLASGRGARRLYLGIRLMLPEGYGMIFKDRSSMAEESIHLLGGVIDPKYRGETSILLINLGPADYWFVPRQKVCQGILVPLVPSKVEEGSVSTATARGEKGFGSSGKVLKGNK